MTHNTEQITVSQSESSVLVKSEKKLCAMLYFQNMVCADTMVLTR